MCSVRRLSPTSAAIIAADDRTVVLANPADRVVWVSRDGGPLAPYSYNACAYAGR
jgi:hypothetical protein